MDFNGKLPIPWKTPHPNDWVLFIPNIRPPQIETLIYRRSAFQKLRYPPCCFIRLDIKILTIVMEEYLEEKPLESVFIIVDYAPA
jgi:hypothetical protein